MRSISDIVGHRKGAVPDTSLVSSGSNRSQSIYRLQVGLSGLAAIVLIVALANVIMDRAHRTEAASVPEAASTVAPSPSSTAKSDPLAEVGVVPDLPDAPEPTPTRKQAVVPGQGDASPTQ